MTFKWVILKVRVGGAPSTTCDMTRAHKASCTRNILRCCGVTMHYDCPDTNSPTVTTFTGCVRGRDGGRARGHCSYEVEGPRKFCFVRSQTVVAGWPPEILESAVIRPDHGHKLVGNIRCNACSHEACPSKCNPDSHRHDCQIRNFNQVCLSDLLRLIFYHLYI